MDSCCTTDTDRGNKAGMCPRCGSKGKAVPLITLKSLLRPSALEQLNPEVPYFYCSNAGCSAVYFDGEGVFTTPDLKVPVFHKDHGAEVPVCYCFDWTRERIVDEVRATGASTAVAQITKHIQVGRCGCEVNNPQGSCCLGNVRGTVKKTMDNIT